MSRNLVGTLILLTAIFTAPAAQAQASGRHAAKPATSVFAPFVGTWKLVSSQERMANGTVRPYGFGPHAIGYLMYDATGHVCAQVVNPDRPRWVDPEHPTAAEIRTAFDGFGGYCGTFTVDPGKHMLTHLPEVSFDPNAVGRRSPRSYSFDNGRLVYEGTDHADDGDAHWTMIWERVP